MAKIKLYEYEKCSTCRNAVKYLERRGIAYKRIPIVEQPPGAGELKKMVGYVGGDFKKLFNTSGQVYRELKLGEKVKTMSEAEALALLAANGKLIKRPFLLLPDNGTVGFKEEEWKKLLK